MPKKAGAMAMADTNPKLTVIKPWPPRLIPRASEAAVNRIPIA